MLYEIGRCSVLLHLWYSVIVSSSSGKSRPLIRVWPRSGPPRTITSTVPWFAPYSFFSGGKGGSLIRSGLPACVGGGHIAETGTMVTLRSLSGYLVFKMKSLAAFSDHGLRWCTRQGSTRVLRLAEVSHTTPSALIASSSDGFRIFRFWRGEAIGTEIHKLFSNTYFFSLIPTSFPLFKLTLLLWRGDTWPSDPALDPPLVSSYLI